MWSTTPFVFTDAPFDLEVMEYGSMSADGTFRSGNPTYDGEPIHFDMQENEADVWYIMKITLTEDPWIPTPEI